MLKESQNEVRQEDIAFLTDRIATQENRPQIYGTQFQNQ